MEQGERGKHGRLTRGMQDWGPTRAKLILCRCVRERAREREKEREGGGVWRRVSSPLFVQLWVTHSRCTSREHCFRGCGVVSRRSCVVTAPMKWWTARVTGWATSAETYGFIPGAFSTSHQICGFVCGPSPCRTWSTSLCNSLQTSSLLLFR